MKHYELDRYSIKHINISACDIYRKGNKLCKFEWVSSFSIQLKSTNETFCHLIIMMTGYREPRTFT